ncbi:MAG: SelB C-terminal domain-containing protein, partial [Nitriliruptorales bacterium]
AWGGAGQRDRLLAAAGTDVEEAEAGLVRLADHLVDAGRLEAWRSAIHDALADEHADDPQSPGARKTPLLGAARRAGCPPSIADDLLESLAAGGDLVRVGAAYVLPGQAPAQDDARRRRREELLATLNQDPFSPPSIDEVAKRIGMHHGELNELVQSGDVVVCGEVAFARGAVAQAVSILRELAAGGRFTTAEAREALGTTRKYAIPLLEHLDATGFTDFDGQTRRVRHAG